MTSPPISPPVSPPSSPPGSPLAGPETSVSGAFQGRVVTQATPANSQLIGRLISSDRQAQNVAPVSLAERTIETGKPSASRPNTEGGTEDVASLSRSKKPSAVEKKLEQYDSDDKRIPGALKITVANKAGIVAQIKEEVEKIKERTKLTTTGYQTGGNRLNNDGPESQTRMSKARAEQYQNAARAEFPGSGMALAGLAKIQQHVNTPSTTNKLSSPIEMSVDELSEAVLKAREHGFANCDLQAMETGNQLYHNLGIKDFTIYSNHTMSHNYLALDQGKNSDELDKQIIVDPWMGTGVADLNDMGIFSRIAFNKVYNHKPDNLKINENMHQWIEQKGAQYAEIVLKSV